ncbi:uncharacterized protein LOC131046091 isoform X1 [Cryptomeria japonica]|uniref:uncharacterized protein LOC131046091 isoform X1 n=1 Tax=Cryptomeria japonica TaxID=3369 RepID=UPI0025AB9CB8|nr:uncharacterized protein LOC131046091 isoform X1 [Cryptomeria japonica]XP_059077660.1 uncharacterized protein LOC131046091 isoform X1 [Cryptomeria japonica]
MGLNKVLVMQRLRSRLHLPSVYVGLKQAGGWRRPLTTQVSEIDENIVSAVVFERLPVILPRLDPALEKFQQFSFQWQHQYRRIYPDEFLQKPMTKEREERAVEFAPAPRVTEADKSNDKRSLHRALDRRLYLIIHGTPYGASGDNPVWHFPEKLYAKEETLRKCAESALQSIIGDLSNVYFVGNAPCGHLVVQSKQSGHKDPSNFKGQRFFSKAQVIDYQMSYDFLKCNDFLWVSKDELLEYFDADEQQYLKKMLIH